MKNTIYKIIFMTIATIMMLFATNSFACEIDATQVKASHNYDEMTELK